MIEDKLTPERPTPEDNLAIGGATLHARLEVERTGMECTSTDLWILRKYAIKDYVSGISIAQLGAAAAFAFIADQFSYPIYNQFQTNGNGKPLIRNGHPIPNPNSRIVDKDGGYTERFRAKMRHLQEAHGTDSRYFP